MKRKLFNLLVILTILMSLVGVVPLALAQDDSSKTEWEIFDLPPPEPQKNKHPRLDSRLNQLLLAETKKLKQHL